MMTDDKIRLVIVDDHEVVRAGIRMLLGQSEDMVVVGEAGTAKDAVALIDERRPDVAVVDVRLPDGSGVHVCREVRSKNPDVAVLILTSYADDEALFQAIVAGASGYLLKQVHGQDLLTAIRTVAGGGSLLDPSVTSRVLKRLRNPDDDPMSTLSEQERKVLALVADGKTNREIAQAMYLSDKTVKHYVSSIIDKLGVARRSAAAAMWAERHRENS